MGQKQLLANVRFWPIAALLQAAWD